MFELTVLGYNVIVPALIALLTAVAALKFTQRGPLAAAAAPDKESAAAEFIRGLILAAGTALAIWTAIALRNQWALWHDQAWMRIPVGTALVALSAAVTAGLRQRWLLWTIRAIAVGTAAVMIFPSGEAWDFLLPRKYYWLGCIWLSPLIGWYCIAARPPRAAATLGLSWILLLIASAFLTGQSFAGVTEPLMAVAAVLGCLSLISLWRDISLLAASAGPCLFAWTAAVASAQFNSFVGLSDILSWLAICSPALAALLTHWLVIRPASSRQHSMMLWLTPVVCLLLAVAIAGWTHWTLPAGGDEW